MRKIKAALFDFDGTLVDTEGQYTKFWTEMTKKYFPDQPDLPEKVKGTTLKDMLSKYIPENMHKTLVDALDEFEMNMDFPIIPGAQEFVSDLKAHGVKCIIVTSSLPVKMGNVAKRLPEFMKLFDFVMTANMFNASKPDPDCFNKGAELAQVPKDECIVFEDSVNGLRAGMASGIYTVGLTTTNPEEVVSRECDKVIPDFCGIDYSRLEEW